LVLPKALLNSLQHLLRWLFRQVKRTFWVGKIDTVVADCDHLENLKFSPVTPHAFTEHDAIMAASVLNSPKAIEVSVFIVRAFVQLRETIAGHKGARSKNGQT
jgi:hypothetical protein